MSIPKTPGRIYVYSAPGYATGWVRTVGSTTVEGHGKLKVGYTGRPDPRVRVKEQTGTVYPDGDGIVIHLDEEAVRADGTFFDDRDVHRVLDAAGVQRASEVVEATLGEVRAAITAVRAGRVYDPARSDDFAVRPEQTDAVEQTAAYFAEHADGAHPPRCLWNAKMRFGKTFTAYQLACRMGWKRVLVLTYKPAVRNSWRDDLSGQVDFADWVFADRDHPCDPDTPSPLVWFASFQDLLGTTPEGSVKGHNEDLHLIDWDCVVLDEYHFGAWQGAAKEVCSPAEAPADPDKAERAAAEVAAEQADEVADRAEGGTPRLITATPEAGISEDLNAGDLRLSSRCYLYLSGTPFRALTEGEFNEDAIFNWTYPDEQAAKRSWDADSTKDPDRNPYRDLPQMQMYTYALAEIASVAIDQGADGLFDLSGFFAAKKVGAEYHFEDPKPVGEFLNMLRGRLTQSATEKLLNNFKPPFPYQRRPLRRGGRTQRLVPSDGRLRPRHEGRPRVVPALQGLPRARRRRQRSEDGRRGQDAGRCHARQGGQARQADDHVVGRQAHDRGYGAPVGVDPRAAVAEVPRVLLPGGVSRAVPVDHAQRRRDPHGQQAHLLRVRLRPQPGIVAHLPVRDQARRRLDQDCPVGGGQRAYRVPADLRLRRWAHGSRRREHRHGLGHRRRRRRHARQALGQPPAHRPVRGRAHQAARRQ
jgi:hypothetical protein